MLRLTSNTIQKEKRWTHRVDTKSASRRHGYGKMYLVGTDTIGVSLHAYPRRTRFLPKKKKINKGRVWAGLKLSKTASLLG